MDNTHACSHACKHVCMYVFFYTTRQTRHSVHNTHRTNATENNAGVAIVKSKHQMTVRRSDGVSTNKHDNNSAPRAGKGTKIMNFSTPSIQLLQGKVQMKLDKVATGGTEEPLQTHDLRAGRPTQPTTGRRESWPNSGLVDKRIVGRKGMAKLATRTKCV